jgi:hypothetical protein
MDAKVSKRYKAQGTRNKAQDSSHNAPIVRRVTQLVACSLYLVDLLNNSISFAGNISEDKTIKNQ